jgi:tetratricopeptide (TPR) repeat protein
MIVTLADTYLNSGRVDQARAVLEDGLAQGIVPPGQRTLYSIAFMRGDVAAMRREIERARGKPTEALIRDRVRAGYAFLGQLRQLADTASAAPSVAASIQQAVALFDFGRPAEACAMVERIPQAEREEIVSRTPGERIALIASCSDAAAVRGIIKTLQQAQPSGAIVNGVVIPTMRAVLALKEGRAAAAADELRAVLSFDQTAAGRRAPYLRGLAYRRLHDPASAIVEFRKITEHRYRFALAVQYPVALAELARAYVDNGQLAEAMTAYDEVVAIWKDADAGLPLVEAVRAERESVRRRLTAGTEAALKREAAPAKKSS